MKALVRFVSTIAPTRWWGRINGAPDAIISSAVLGAPTTGASVNLVWSTITTQSLASTRHLQPAPSVQQLQPHQPVSISFFFYGSNLSIFKRQNEFIYTL